MLSDNKIIFSEVLDDPQVTVSPIHGMDALVIRQPVRKDNEPMSDPSQWFETTYLWDASTKSFDKYNETTGFYITPTPSTSPTISPISSQTNKSAIQTRINQIDQQIANLKQQQQRIYNTTQSLSQCTTPLCMGMFNTDTSLFYTNQAQIQQLKNEKADLELQLK